MPNTIFRRILRLRYTSLRLQSKCLITETHPQPPSGFSGQMNNGWRENRNIITLRISNQQWLIPKTMSAYWLSFLSPTKELREDPEAGNGSSGSLGWSSPSPHGCLPALMRKDFEGYTCPPFLLLPMFPSWLWSEWPPTHTPAAMVWVAPPCFRAMMGLRTSETTGQHRKSSLLQETEICNIGWCQIPV